jgi:hypothetical protein
MMNVEGRKDDKRGSTAARPPPKNGMNKIMIRVKPSHDGFIYLNEMIIHY